MIDSPLLKHVAVGAAGVVLLASLSSDAKVREAGRQAGKCIAAITYAGTSGTTQMVGVPNTITAGFYQARPVRTDRDTVAAMGAARLLGFTDHGRS